MEFWGVEVKAGEPVKVDPLDFDSYIHISQAALGETKKDKGAEPVVLYLKFGDQKLVLGTLSKDNFPQISFDLVLEKEFELSHNSKYVSVFFCGYKAEIPEEDTGDDDFDDMSDSEEDIDLPAIAKDNGKLDTKAGLAKVAQSKKSDATFNDSKKQAKDEPKDEEDDEDDDSEEEDDEEGGSDEDVMDADSDSDEDEDDEETPKKQTPKKADLSKKRPNDSALKTPVSAKKAKSGTPEKNDAKKGGHTSTPHPDAKKGGHTSTPHPMKKGAKTPNSEAKEPKSGGQLSCKSCSKSFNSESGFQQHNKAKHGGQ